MIPNLNLEIVFVALAIIFVGQAFQDYLRSEGKLTLGRKTRLRIAFIFSGIGILLYAVQIFS